MVVIDFGKFQLNNQLGSENQEAGNKAKRIQVFNFFFPEEFKKIILS